MNIDVFLTAKSAAGLAATTITWYSRHLTPYQEFLQDDGGDLCDPDTVRRFLSDRRRLGLKPNSVDAYYRSLSAWYAFMADEGRLSCANPMVRVKRPKRPRTSPRRVSAEQYEALLESIPHGSWIDLRDRLFVQMLFLCGIRVSELVGLSVRDVDITARLLRVVGKGSKERLVPIYPSIGPALLEYLLLRPPWDGPELLLSNDGAGGVRGRLTASGVRQRLRKLCTAAGVPYTNPHAFRHGLAMHLLNNGHADMSLIQRIFGHAQITTTQRVYAEWITSGMITAYDEAMQSAERRKQ